MNESGDFAIGKPLWPDSLIYALSGIYLLLTRQSVSIVSDHRVSNGHKPCRNLVTIVAKKSAPRK